MKLLKLTAAFAATCGVIWLLSSPIAKGVVTIPPIGPLLNPFSGFWRNAEPLTGPNMPDQVILPGLKGKAEVVYDDLFIPHIFAENDEDAAMLQGYITAQNRLFQMDLTVRKISGRLSEVIGERTLSTDIMSRRKGLGYSAERDLEAAKKSPEDLQLMEAYTAGVNAWISQLKPADYPIEFKLLGYQPEPWTLLNCAMVVEGMADMLANYDNDMEATNALQLLGKATYESLYPTWNPKQQPVIPAGNYPLKPTALPQKTSPKAGNLIGFAPGGETPDELIIDPAIKGSNNWAVAGSRTASGHPLLSNDPHLSLSLPSIWYQIQIHTPSANRYGVSLPGAPGIIIGFNEHIAWGITNVGADVSDWYKIKWSDASRTNYLLDGKNTPAQMRIETIQVKGRPEAISDTVRYTVWGPVVYDDPKEPLYDCAFRWLTHDIGKSSPASQFAHLDRATNFDEYTAALTDFDCPPQNFVFADNKGDIALRVQGNFPIRQGDEGRFIQDGTQSANAWHEFVPQDEIPKMHNPSRGFVASSNQNSTDPSYPYYAKYGDWEQYRSRRAVHWLEKMEHATVDSMKAMQNSNFSFRAQDAQRAMLKLISRNELDAAQQLLLNDIAQWNCSYDKDLTAPMLFEMWFDSTYYQTFDEIITIRDQKIKIQLPHSWRLIDFLERDTNNIVFDLKSSPEKETARQIVTLAFKKMTGQAAKEAAAGTLIWGHAHSLSINHLAKIAPFSRTNIPIGGHRSALNAILRDYGPSWRMIVDLGDQVKGVGVYPGGQSGNPGSRFYDNMIDKWVNGEYYDLLFLKSPAEAPADKVLKKQTFSAQ